MSRTVPKPVRPEEKSRPKAYPAPRPSNVGNYPKPRSIERGPDGVPVKCTGIFTAPVVELAATSDAAGKDLDVELNAAGPEKGLNCSAIAYRVGIEAPMAENTRLDLRSCLVGSLNGLTMIQLGFDKFRTRVYCKVPDLAGSDLTEFANSAVHLFFRESH